MSAPLFWQTPIRYLRYASHEYPALFYSVVLGAAGPAILLVTPPLRRSLGYDDTPEIPHSYPVPKRARDLGLTGFDDE